MTEEINFVEEDCTQCGTSFEYLKLKKVYDLGNDGYVCSKKCLKAYALDYFDYSDPKVVQIND